MLADLSSAPQVSIGKTDSMRHLGDQGMLWLPCPKWHNCSAPICPLDAKWANRSIQSEDAICFYLSEAVKDGAAVRFEGAGLGEMFRQVTKVLPELVSSSGRIRRTLERASLNGSRMDRRIPERV